MSSRRTKAQDAATAASCRCGHAKEAHEHLRRGSDCGQCGPVKCPKYAASSSSVRWTVRRPARQKRQDTAGVVLEHPTRTTAAELPAGPDEGRRRTGIS